MSKTRDEFKRVANIGFDKVIEQLTTDPGRRVANHCRPEDDETAPMVIGLVGYSKMLVAMDECHDAICASLVSVLAQMLINDLEKVESNDPGDSIEERIRHACADIGVVLGMQMLCLNTAKKAMELESFEHIGDVLDKVLQRNARREEADTPESMRKG